MVLTHNFPELLARQIAILVSITMAKGLMRAKIRSPRQSLPQQLNTLLNSEMKPHQFHIHVSGCLSEIKGFLASFVQMNRFSPVEHGGTARVLGAEGVTEV